MHTFMQNYFFTYDETKDDISLHFLAFYIEYIWCPDPFTAVVLEKTYLTTSEKLHKRLLAIFHTKETYSQIRVCFNKRPFYRTND